MGALWTAYSVQSEVPQTCDAMGRCFHLEAAVQKLACSTIEFLCIAIVVEVHRNAQTIRVLVFISVDALGDHKKVLFQR